MKLISFDPLRTLHFPTHTCIKPEHFLAHLVTLQEADWLLFPEYWQINALIYELKARIFPSQASYLIGHNKIEMTRAFQTVAPQHLPLTYIKKNTPNNADWIWEQLPQPFVAKFTKSSMGEGVFLIETRQQWSTYCQNADVLYAQEQLPIDRDLRLVVIGNKVVGGYWRLQSADGFHNNIARGGQVFAGPVPEAAKTLVENIALKLEINHAGFDVAMVGNHPYLLEFNRIFGSNGVNQLIGDLTPFIIDYLRSQMENIDPTKPHTASGTPTKKRRRKAA